jgi:hypothetical protein
MERGEEGEEVIHTNIYCTMWKWDVMILRPRRRLDYLPFDTKDDVGKIKVVSAHVLSRLNRSLEDVLTINSNLLSHQNLLLQTKACEFFTVAFRLLSSIQHHDVRNCVRIRQFMELRL